MQLQQATPLGKTSGYTENYSPELLCPVSRAETRSSLPLSTSLPFHGSDLWTCFEVSWLDLLGKPQVAIGHFAFSCTSPFLIESKSFKLYLGSLTQTSFRSKETLIERLTADLQQASGAPVSIELLTPDRWQEATLRTPCGLCIDGLEVTVDTYRRNSHFLQAASSQRVEEELYSHLLKSLCPVTGQPDWGSLYLRYKGAKIDHTGLLRYIISLRSEVGFAEHSVELIFCDLMERCSPDELTVYGLYTRRGGIDINPIRSNATLAFDGPVRTARQ